MTNIHTSVFLHVFNKDINQKGKTKTRNEIWKRKTNQTGVCNGFWFIFVDGVD